jgi:hypothetical protein
MNDAFAALTLSLAACRAGALPVAALAREWRGQAILLPALPPRYTQVLEDILGRLESAALFGGESCSFSQRDLLDALSDWLDKAQSIDEATGAKAKTE